MWRVLLVLVLACGDKRKPPPPKVTDAAVPDVALVKADPCEARAKHLSDRLDTLAHEKPGSLPMVLPAVELPSSTEGKVIDAPGAVIVVTKNDEIYILDQHAPLARAGALFQELMEKPATQAESSGKGPRRPWTLYIWADRDTRAGTLTRIVGGFGFNWAARLLVDGDAVRPPELTKAGKQLADELAKHSPEEAVELRGKAMRTAADPCKPLPGAYASTEAGPVEELAMLAKKVPEAIVACRCNLSDWDTFEYAMLTIFGAFHPTPRWIELRKVKPTDKTVDDLTRE